MIYIVFQTGHQCRLASCIPVRNRPSVLKRYTGHKVPLFSFKTGIHPDCDTYSFQHIRKDAAVNSNESGFFKPSPAAPQPERLFSPGSFSGKSNSRTPAGSKHSISAINNISTLKPGLFFTSTAASHGHCPHGNNRFEKWSLHPDLNRRPHPYQGCALPTELCRLIDFTLLKNGTREGT